MTIISSGATEYAAATTQQTTPFQINTSELKNTLEKDVISISTEARLLNAEEADSQTETASQSTVTEEDWKERYGLESGTTRLSNGNKRVVNISGDEMEILEYDGDKLVSSITGKMSDTGLSLYAESYDANGNVVRKTQSTLTGLEGDAAKMTRSVQWFDSDELVRNMRESMVLTDVDSFGDVDDLLTSDLEARLDTLGLDGELVPDMTLDKHQTEYSASIQEYGNGRLLRDTTIEQNTEYANLTNRSDEKIGDFDEHSTEELWHSINLSVDVKEYDEEGELLRTVDFKDGHKDGRGSTDGELTQSINVAWYDKGELVRTGSGTLTMEEAEGAKLSKRQTFLELFQLKAEEYANTDPLSAEQTFTKRIAQSADDGDYFTNALRKHMGSGHYGDAEDLADWGTEDNPYSLTWKSSVYADGEITARQEDRESARENTRNPGLSFRTGGSLTEDAQEGLLRETEHVDENWENGRVKRQASLKSREFYETREDGADILRTTATGELSEGLQNETITKTLVGGVEANDSEARAASQGMALETELTFHDLFEELRDAD